VRREGCASDLAFGGDGSLYALGCQINKNGIIVLKWVENKWTRYMFAGGTMLAVDGAGAPWVVNNKTTLFKWDQKE